MRKLAAILVLLASAGAAGAAVQASTVDVTAACANALRLDAITRKAHADVIRNVLVDAFPARGAASATRFAIDVSLVELEVTTVRGQVEIRAQVRAVVSDDQRRIVWLGTCGAKVQIPARWFRSDQLVKYQREAIDAATAQLVRPLRAELRRASDSSARRVAAS